MVKDTAGGVWSAAWAEPQSNSVLHAAEIMLSTQIIKLTVLHDFYNISATFYKVCLLTSASG